MTDLKKLAEVTLREIDGVPHWVIPRDGYVVCQRTAIRSAADDPLSSTELTTISLCESLSARQQEVETLRDQLAGQETPQIEGWIVRWDGPNKAGRWQKEFSYDKGTATALVKELQENGWLTVEIYPVLRALQQHTGEVPQYVRVPREPTEAMLLAGHQKIDWCRNDQDTYTFDHPSQRGAHGAMTNCREDLRDAYKAMLAALEDGETKP